MHKKLRIAFVTPAYRMYGAGGAVYRNVKRMNLDEFEPHIVLVRYGKLKQALEEEGISNSLEPWMANLENKGLISRFKRLKRLINWLREYKTAILDLTLHPMFDLDVFYAAARLAGCRLVVRNRAQATWLPLKDKWFISKADAVVSVARRSMEAWTVKRRSDLLCRIDERRVRIIPDGRDLGVLKEASFHSGLWKDLGIPQDAQVVGIVGSIDPNKNQALFIDAARRICSVRKDTYFLIIGDASLDEGTRAYEKSLKDKVQNLGLSNRILFTGNREDALSLMKGMKALVIPSKTEGLGLVAIEAMGLGVPVIAANTGGLGEIITHEINGFLVDSPEAFRYSALILKCLDNEDMVSQISENAKLRAGQFDLSITNKLEEECYLELAGKSKLQDISYQISAELRSTK